MCCCSARGCWYVVFFSGNEWSFLTSAPARLLNCLLKNRSAGSILIFCFFLFKELIYHFLVVSNTPTHLICQLAGQGLEILEVKNWIFPLPLFSLFDGSRFSWAAPEYMIQLGTCYFVARVSSRRTTEPPGGLVTASGSCKSLDDGT